MTTTRLETKLQILSWDEKPYRELDDGQKFTRTAVTNSVKEDGIEAETTSDSLMYYSADGTSAYVGLTRITGRLGDREGSFVLRENGTYDGTTARTESVIVPGSGTGGLAGLTGTGISVSTKDDYPHMPLVLEYQLA
jgi:hypothetical protein